MTEKDTPLALVAGAGPGLGHALLRRFADGGLRAVGLARSGNPAGKGLDHRLVDLTDAAAVQSIVGALIAEHGAPRIVVHNPAHLVINAFTETTLQDYEQTWRSMVLSAAIVGQCVLMPMVRAGGGAFIVSGATASLRGGARFSAFASAKFALRGLTQSLASEFQSSGVHVVHCVLDGIIDTPASRELHDLDPTKMMQPEDIAEAYWQLAQQPASTWTHEVDLRPRSESF